MKAITEFMTTDTAVTLSMVMFMPIIYDSHRLILYIDALCSLYAALINLPSAIIKASQYLHDTCLDHLLQTMCII